MNAYGACKEYLALKQHFTKENYDYIKYNGKVRLSPEAFDKRKDRLFFEKIAKHPDLHGFLVANFSDNPKHWIRDLAYSDSAERVYADWLKRNQSLAYNYKTDFRKILEEEQGDHHHPPAVRLYLGGEISLESLCIFVAMTEATEQWDSKLKYDPVWDEVRMKIVKYTPFVKFDRSKIKKVMLDILDDIGYTK